MAIEPVTINVKENHSHEGLGVGAIDLPMR